MVQQTEKMKFPGREVSQPQHKPVAHQKARVTEDRIALLEYSV